MLAVIAVVVLVIILFRWLSSHSGKAGDNGYAAPERETATEKSPEKLSNFSRSPVIRVRLQYRKFLSFCRSKGIDIKRSSTSRDVCNSCRGYFDQDAVEELRNIYINARYNDKATAEEVESAKELFNQVKKSVQI